jgi:hypothetical protein
MSATRRTPTTTQPLWRLGVLLLAGGLTLPAAQATVYDFEALSVQTLNGQDGWLRQPNMGHIVIRTDETVVNGSLVAEPDLGLASGSYALLSRVNTASFGYSPFLGTESAAVLQFDSTGHATIGFALGHDVNGDGLLQPILREVGPVFGTLRDDQQGIEQFAIAAPNLATLHVAPLTTVDRPSNAAEDWYRLQLRMDLGAGTGSLYYMNLSEGDTEFQAVTELQDIDLGLGQLDPAAGPAAWDAMWLAMRFDGKQSLPASDNLVPRIPVVQQPDGDLSLQAVDATDVYGAKFDVVLEAVASNPGESCWQLGSFSAADPNTESTATLLPTLDVDIAATDVLALFPDAAGASSVQLQLSAGSASDPASLVWCLAP